MALRFSTFITAFFFLSSVSAITCGNGKKIDSFVWMDKKGKRAIAVSGLGKTLAIHRCSIGSKDPSTCKLLFLGTRKQLCDLSNTDRELWTWMPVLFGLATTIPSGGGSLLIPGMAGKVVTIGGQLIQITDAAEKSLKRSDCPRAKFAEFILDSKKVTPEELEKIFVEQGSEAPDTTRDEIMDRVRKELGLKYDKERNVSHAHGKLIMHYGQMEGWRLYHSSLIALDEKSGAVSDLDGQACSAMERPSQYEQENMPKTLGGAGRSR